LGKTANLSGSSKIQTEKKAICKTKTEYSSDQRMLVVLPEMEQLLPPLSAEQFSSFQERHLVLISLASKPDSPTIRW
jgi:hypothetical protein